jgi:hypothetical protein
MAFDPDKYLAQKQSAPPAAFDPDAYLRATSNGIPAPRRTGTRVDQIPGSSVAAPAPTAAPERPESGFFGKLLAPLETAVTLGTSAITAPIVEGAKIYGALTSGKFGTQQGIKAGEATGRKVQQFFQPQVSPESEAQTQAIGNMLARTGLQGVPLNMMGNLATLAGPSVQQVAPVVKAPIEARQRRIQTQRVKESELAAPRIDAAKDALELGLALDPAISKPTTANRIRTGAIGTTSLQSNLSKINLPQVAKVAREDMGLPETAKLDAKAFETARNAPGISGAYDKVRALPTVAADESVLGRIDSLRVTPMIGDTGQAAAINNFLDTIKGQLQAGTNGETTVKSIRQLRRDAQAIYNQQSAGINPPSPEAIARADINMGVANALETAIENSITDPRLVTDFRNARTALARTYDYERATNLATGVVDPQALASLAAEGRPLSGKLAKLANVAANFPEVTQGGLVREPTWREKATRSGAAGTAGAIIGSPFGLPGAIVGGAAGAASGNIASALMARRMASPGYQRSRAIPQDYRPIPSGLRPVEPNTPINALAPYDYSQQAFTPPNFVMQPNQYPPRATFVGPETGGPPQLGYGGTMETLAAERQRAAGMSRTLGQQAEQQAAAAEAAARRPTRGGQAFELDPVTGRLVPVDTTLRGATPDIQIIESTGKSLSGAADILSSGKSPALMSAEQRIAWEKTKVDLAEAVPGMKALSDKALATKMMDRVWLQETIDKVKQKAQMQADIAARSQDLRLRQAAMMEREKLQSNLEMLEEQFRKARPVKTGGQGPKTRAFQRNMLTPEQEIQNALAK